MKYLFLLISALAFQLSTPAIASASVTVNLLDYDSACGQANYNCRPAFQSAFAFLKTNGGGVLNVPAGTFLIDFPEVPQNVASDGNLATTTLIAVPANTMVKGHIGADGTPDTIIQWRVTNIPVFTFGGASYSGLSDLHITFIGTAPAFYAYGDNALVSNLGYKPAILRGNQMASGNYELFSFAFVFDSEFCTFNDLVFDSATHDNAHTFGYAINMKGKSLILSGGSGLSGLANNNTITNVKLYDDNTGFLVAGQNGIVISNITDDRRGSSSSIPPGHVLYTTGTSQWDATNVLINTMSSTNVTVDTITDGPNSYSNNVALGTLAIKNITGGTVQNIVSQHPAGLLQTYASLQNVTFKNMSWQSDSVLCDLSPSNCGTPVLNSVVNAATAPVSANLTFQNISLVATGRPISTSFLGDNVQINGITIRTSPLRQPGQANALAVIAISRTASALIANYDYWPLLNTYNAQTPYNVPFEAWNPSSNVTAQVTVHWPRTLPVPSPLTPVVTALVQDSNPLLKNSVSSQLVLSAAIIPSVQQPSLPAGSTLTLTFNEPVNLSLSTNTSGTINCTSNCSAVTFTAPASVPVVQDMGGCAVSPVDSIWSTPVNTLPLNANSANWIARLTTNYPTLYLMGAVWAPNIVDNSLASTSWNFYYTTPLNGLAWQTPPRATMHRENGAFAFDGANDHHSITVNRQTCQFYEIYKDAVPFPPAPQTTATSGYTFAWKPTSTTAFSPAGNVIQISAGSSVGAGTYVPDQSFTGGSAGSTSSAVDTSAVTNPAPQSVYQNERYGAPPMSYNLTGLVPGQQYTVRLHFAETFWPAIGQRVFNVTINNSPALTNFDIFQAAGGGFKAYAQSFFTNADGSGNILINFTNGSADKPKVNGIELSTAGGTATSTTLVNGPYDLTTLGSTTVAALPITRTTLTLDDIKRGVVKHMTSMTLNAGEYISGIYTDPPACTLFKTIYYWPAMGSGGGSGCASTVAQFPGAGSMLRLKASYDISSFSPTAQVVLNGFKNYGLIVQDTGTTNSVLYSADCREDPNCDAAMQSIQLTVPMGQFEFVDQSSLMVSPTSSRVNPSNTAGVVPAAYAVMTASDTVGDAPVVIPFAIQPIAVGTKYQQLTIQAGTFQSPGYQIPTWVTGSANQSVTWALTSGTGAVTTSGVYTPPATASAVSTTVLTGSAAADTSAKILVTLYVIPLGTNPATSVRIDTGAAGNFVDPSGNTWFGDGQLPKQVGSSYKPTPGPAWTGVALSQIYQTEEGGSDDTWYAPIVMPSGNYKLRFMSGRQGCCGTWSNVTTPYNLALINSGANLFGAQGVIQRRGDPGISDGNGTPTGYLLQKPSEWTIPAKVGSDNLLIAAMFSSALPSQTSNIGVVKLSGLEITPDVTTPPHWSIDLAQQTIVAPGGTVQCYVTDYYTGLSDPVWSIASGPGTIDSTSGLVTANATQPNGGSGILVKVTSQSSPAITAQAVVYVTGAVLGQR